MSGLCSNSLYGTLLQQTEETKTEQKPKPLLSKLCVKWFRESSQMGVGMYTAAKSVGSSHVFASLHSFTCLLEN